MSQVHVRERVLTKIWMVRMFKITCLNPFMMEATRCKATKYKNKTQTVQIKTQCQNLIMSQTLSKYLP